MTIVSGLFGFDVKHTVRNFQSLVQIAFRAVDDQLDGNVQVVQVGANDGKLDDPLNEILTQGRWRALLLEPHPVYFQDLCQSYSDQRGVICRNIGIADRPGEMMLHHVREGLARGYPDWLRGCASLSRDRMMDALKMAAARTGVEIRDDDLQSTPVRVERLENVLAAENIDRIDVLVIDVEGYELAVLGSFDIASAGVSVALVECNGSSLPEQNDYVAAIEKAGLDVFRLGDDLIGIDPARVKISVSDMMRWTGYKPLGVTQDATATT